MSNPSHPSPENPGSYNPDNTAQDTGRWFWLALLPFLTGLLWLGVGWNHGLLTGVFASLPGALLTASGLALFLWPGDRQISHYMAFGSVLSLLLSLLMLLSAGLFWGLLFAALAAANFVVSGYAALYQDVPAAGVPTPSNRIGMAAKVAIDEVLLAYFVSSANVPTGTKIAQDVAEVGELTRALEEQGWLASPADMHRAPTAPDKFELLPREASGKNFEHLIFDSGFEPPAGLPGAQRWLDYTSNRRMHAWVFRHNGPPRPWLLGIHGYRMGVPFMDFSLFDIDYLHHKLGLNLILPILPLHGPRRAYKRSGSGYLDGNIIDMLHAQTHALWDVRSALAWVRQAQSAEQVGVMGYSLGGYNTALLSSLEGDLSCAIAGIPLTDMAAAVWRHMPELQRRQLQMQGLDVAQIQRVLTPVSPLALTPRISHEKRYIFAATGDQLVPSDQAVRLYNHWQQPETLWYQGSHLSVRREAGVRRFVADALANAGLREPRHDAACGTSQA